MKLEVCDDVLQDDSVTATAPAQVIDSSLRLGAWKLAISAYEGIEKLLWRYRRQQQRLDLMSLSDSQLKDIGVSRAEAEYEGGKGFWD